MGVFLCHLSVLSAFGGRAGFEVIRDHVFPQDVLAAITLVGEEAGDWAKDRARCEPELAYAQWSSPCYDNIFLDLQQPFP